MYCDPLNHLARPRWSCGAFAAFYVVAHTPCHSAHKAGFVARFCQHFVNHGVVVVLPFVPVADYFRLAGPGRL